MAWLNIYTSLITSNHGATLRLRGRGGYGTVGLITNWGGLKTLFLTKTSPAAPSPSPLPHCSAMPDTVSVQYLWEESYRFTFVFTGKPPCPVNMVGVQGYAQPQAAQLGVPLQPAPLVASPRYEAPVVRTDPGPTPNRAETLQIHGHSESISDISIINLFETKYRESIVCLKYVSHRFGEICAKHFASLKLYMVYL